MVKFKKISFFKHLFVMLILILFILLYFRKDYIAVGGSRNNDAYQNRLGWNIPYENTTAKQWLSFQKTNNGRIVLALVVCDKIFEQSLNVVKSVILFTITPVHFVIFADDILLPRLNSTLKHWGKYNLTFELLRIDFPAEHREVWLSLFRKCAALRLFIPSLVPHIDSVIYLDTDTLMLGPADDLWRQFKLFNSSHIAGASAENNNTNVAWYPRFAKHPYYGEFGLNSGVMLMNLTRMRQFHWVDYLSPILLKYSMMIPWGDQDIINIIFHYHSRSLFELSCRYNFRSDQCMYGNACVDAASSGVHVVHGNRNAFRDHNQPMFRAVYDAIDQHQLGTDPKIFLRSLKKHLNEMTWSNCEHFRDAIVQVPTKTIVERFGELS